MSEKITTPYDRVLIDPNEPLILPDGTAIVGRLEMFLYALCCLDYDNIPTPLSRIEEFANALITGTIPNIEPQSRSEQFFLAILDGDTNNLPEPQSRSEVLLNKLAIGDFDLSDVEPIQSRYELLLAYLIKNGGIGNLDYVFYTFVSENETLYNTKERPVKSAILKGQTLVNTITNVEGQYSWVTVDNVTFTHVKDSPSFSFINYNCSLKPNTKYFIRFEYDYVSNENLRLQFGFRTNLGGWDSHGITSTKGVNKATLTTNGTSNNLSVIIMSGQTLESASFGKLMIIEYQEGMENRDIPYFTGMASVKMPVLTTVGKNLIDKDKLVDGFVRTDGTISLPDYGNKTTGYIKVKPNTTYSYSTYNIDRTLTGGMLMDLWMYYSDIGTISSVIQTRQQENNKTTISFTTPSDCKYLRIGSRGLNQEGTYAQLEESPSITLYEPYKSNILTVNEDITLRSNGDVYDELNLLTGRLTQRIDENNEVLSQEVVKTVDLSAVDQDGNDTELSTFDDITHVTLSSEGLIPKAELEVATKNEEVLNTMSLEMDDISATQTTLEETSNIQNENIDSTMIATTEIYEGLL